MLRAVPVERIAALVERAIRRGSAHDRHWREHPAVPTDDQLTFGQRAADWLKAIVATWTALWVVLAAIVWWLYAGGFPAGSDAPGYLHLNLALSCFAALQCFILLIAAKRADQIAAATALHTLQNTEAIKTLIEQLTEMNDQQLQILAQQNEILALLKAHTVPEPPPPAKPAALPRTPRKRTPKKPAQETAA